MSRTLGKLREYETVFVTGADMSEEQTNELYGKVREVLVKNGGSVLREDTWGKKKFAFDVRKHPRGSYLVLHYAAPAAAVTQLERALRNSDAIIRFVTNRLGEVHDLETRRADVEKSVREKAAREAAEAARRAAEADEAQAAAPQDA